MIEKLWGHMIPLYRDDSVELVKVLIQAGKKSSIHHHRKKDNYFILHKGSLLVHLFHMRNGEPLRTKTQALHSNGGAYLVVAGVWHQFEALEDTEAHEFYTQTGEGALDPEDIVRHPITT